MSEGKAYFLEVLHMSNAELDAELGSISIHDFRKNVRLALEEQDYETRCACAAALNGCSAPTGAISFKAAYYAIKMCINGVKNVR